MTMYYSAGRALHEATSESRASRAPENANNVCMNDITVSNTSDEPTSLTFSDAESCAVWLRGLPLTNVPKLHSVLLDQLKRLSEAEFSPRERARIAEVFREPVSFVHTELARRYAGKPQPANERELEATEQTLALWQALWEQYSACLKPMLEGDPELQGLKQKVLQRGLYVGKQVILVHALARRVPPAWVWQELHAYYRLAEILDCTVTAVSDELSPSAIGVSCYSTYSHAILLNLADPCAMSIRQIELTDRWLGMWARKVFPYADQRETEGPVIVVDLDAAQGAVLMNAAPGRGGESMRYAYPAKIGTSVRGRIKRIGLGANPAELQLGNDASAEACTTLLSHLDACWYSPSRASKADADAVLALCVGGLAAAYFRVAGRTFNRNDPSGRLSYQGSQHLATLDALTGYDRNRDDAEKSWAWESWEGTRDAVECKLRRPGNGAQRWHLEQLVVARDADGMRCGFVTRVALDDDELWLTIRLWSGPPSAFSVRAMTSMMSEDAPIAALLLGATPDEKACLVLPSRTFTADRMLRSLPDGGPERRFKLTRVLQRGADFERVAFEEKDA